jgi:23S rRNA (pseudouridine1915-N3)-methyltransferase
MSRELVVLWAGRHRRSDWDQLCLPYTRRISRHVRIREVAIKARTTGGGRERLRAEGEAILAAIPEGAWTIALDRRGKMRSSRELARWLQKRLESWSGPLAFLVGSDLGLSTEVLDQARERLSFGPLTLPHEMARLVLLEQLYRGLAITAGIKYHREPL